jgi:hypothetical protein
MNGRLWPAARSRCSRSYGRSALHSGRPALADSVWVNSGPSGPTASLGAAVRERLLGRQATQAAREQARATSSAIDEGRLRALRPKRSAVVIGRTARDAFPAVVERIGLRLPARDKNEAAAVGADGVYAVAIILLELRRWR